MAIIADYQQNPGRPSTACSGTTQRRHLDPELVNVTGDPDLDGDGIGIMSDPGELAAYKAACEDMVAGLRARLGEGFLQIFNGQRAYTDSTFAALCDGMNYELFPTLGFQAPDKMRKAMDPAVYNSLWHARAGAHRQRRPLPAAGEHQPRLLLRRPAGADHAQPGRLVPRRLAADRRLLPGLGRLRRAPVRLADVVHSLGAPLGPTALSKATSSRGTTRTGTSAWRWSAASGPTPSPTGSG
ncbi:MAG: hypothetical protein IPH09_11090 [bacterium]|nr:hypothetical protein [bacterium]